MKKKGQGVKILINSRKLKKRGKTEKPFLEFVKYFHTKNNQKKVNNNIS
jgi:hypothetical protein